MVNTQYNEMLTIGGTWTKAKPKRSAFIGEGAAVQPCTRYGKIHTGPCQVMHWSRTKPKENEANTKQVNGKIFYWCNMCNCWNYAHLTADHVTKAEMKKKQEASNTGSGAAANIVSDTLTESGSSTSGSTSGDASLNFSSYNLAAISQAHNDAFKSQFATFQK